MTRWIDTKATSTNGMNQGLPDTGYYPLATEATRSEFHLQTNGLQTSVLGNEA